MDNMCKPTPVLLGLFGPLDGHRWILNKIHIIGRESACDMVIPDLNVSRRHARIIPTKAGIVLEDLGSKNGTHCNGDRIAKPVILQDGDVVQIVFQDFVFIGADATMALESLDHQGSLAMIDME